VPEMQESMTKTLNVKAIENQNGKLQLNTLR
jgi:hypothetical protein